MKINGHQLRIGLIVNPVAGLGGAVALQGSDGKQRQQQAIELGAQPRAEARCRSFLEHLKNVCPAAEKNIQWLTWSGAMGADVLADFGWAYQLADGQDEGAASASIMSSDQATTAGDSQRAAAALLTADVDCLVFVGGDGTARDLMAVLGDRLPVIGVPAGVKMHSGVFAVSPRTAALLVGLLIDGGLVARTLREVRDYAEDQASASAINVRTYGEMCVPQVAGYLQQTKIGGKESEPLVVEEICAYIIENLPPERDVVIGPGSTGLAIKQALGIEGTLRGCDVLLADGGGAINNANAAQLNALVNPLLVVSFTRGQGFLFGRGNQQLNATFLASLSWPDDVRIVASRTKLLSLEQRPLLLDTGDDELDARLSGLVEVITGYEDSLLYRLAGFAL